MYQIYRRWQHIFCWANIRWIIYWYGVCIIVWNESVQVGVIWINVDWVGIFAIPNHRIFAPNLFNFKTIFVLRFFENIVASKVFTFSFLLYHSMTILCRRYLTSFWKIWRCQSCLNCWSLLIWFLWVPLGSSQCGYQYSSRILHFEHQYHYPNSRVGISSDKCVPVCLLGCSVLWSVE